MAFDATALVLSYLLSTLLRYDGVAVERVWGHAFLLALAAVTVHLVVGSAVGVYRGRFAVASIDETLFLGLATGAGGLVVTLANAWSEPLWLARSVPLSATFLGLFCMLIARALLRYQTDRPSGNESSDSQRTLVVGAGDTGSRLAQSMLANPEAGLVPVGFLDDDRWKRHRQHYGVRVLATLADLERAVAETGAQAVVVAIPSADGEVIRRVSDQSRALGVSVKVLPSFAETFSTRADVRDVRGVDMRDILGRAAIDTDLSAISGYVSGKRVLVTGAGGSIGSELCRQLDKFGPAELMMLDRDESALHSVQLSLRVRALLDSDESALLSFVQWILTCRERSLAAPSALSLPP